MRQSFVYALMALSLSACTVPVVANIGDGNAFTGTAHKGMLPGSGTITMANKEGLTCEGTFSRLEEVVKSFWVGQTLVRPVGFVPHYGVAALRCSDGSSASLRYRELNERQGYGSGKTSNGDPISFVYGVDESSARTYLLLPIDDPKESQNSQSSGESGRQTSKSTAIELLGSGTGFFISNQGHILTNAHVVRGCEYMQLQTVDGAQYKGQILFRDERTDLSVVKASVTPPLIATFPATSKYRLGDDVIAFGFPYGASQVLSSSGVLTTGTISALTGMYDNSSEMQINAEIQPGNSGGPLSDRFGNVVGVNAARISDAYALKISGQIAQNINFAIKELMAKSFLQAHSVPFMVKDRNAPMSNADIADEMKKYSVYLMCYGHPQPPEKPHH